MKSKLLNHRLSALDKRITEFRELKDNFDIASASNQTYTPLSLKFSAADDTYHECGVLAQEVVTLSSNKAELIGTFQPKLIAANDFLNEAYLFIARVGDQIREKSLSPAFADAQEALTGASLPPPQSSDPPSVSEPPSRSDPSSLLPSTSGTTTTSVPPVLGRSSRTSAGSAGSLNSLQRANMKEKEAKIRAKAVKAKAELEWQARAARAEAEAARGRG